MFWGEDFNKKIQAATVRAALVLSLSASALAQTPAPGPSSSSSDPNPYVPNNDKLPTFLLDGARDGAAMSLMSGSCMRMNQMIHGAADVAKLVGAPTNASGALDPAKAADGCGFADIQKALSGIPDASDRCEDIQDKGGIYSQKKLDDILGSIDKALKLATCQRDATEKLKAEVDCLISSQNGLSKMIDMQMNGARQIFQQAQTMIKSMQAQQKDLQQDSAAMAQKVKQLSDQKAATDAMDQAFLSGGGDEKSPAILTDIHNTVLGYHTAQSQYESDVAARKMALAYDCLMRSKGAGVIVNGSWAAANWVDSLFGAYDQSYRTNWSSDTKDPDGASRAGRDTALLQNNWTTILGRIPQDSNFPALNDGNRASWEAANTKNKILNEKTFLKNIRAALGPYNVPVAMVGGGTSTVEALIEKQFDACYKSANTQVEAERTQPSSNIGATAVDIESKRTGALNKAKGIAEQLGKLYQGNMQAITGQSAPPLNLAECQGNLDQAESCLNNMKAFLDSTVNTNGGLQASMYTLGYKHQHPAPGAIPAQQQVCVGLNDCIQQATKLNDYLGQNYQEISNAIPMVANSMNQQIMAYQRNMIQQLNTAIPPAKESQVAEINDRLNVVKNALSKLGVDTSGLTTKDIAAETPEGDESLGGLLKEPKNYLAWVGGNMSPPLQTFDATGWNGGNTPSSDPGAQAVASKLASLGGLKHDFQALGLSCKADQKKDLDKQRTDLINDLVGNNCLVEPADQKSTLGQIISDVCTAVEGLESSCTDTTATGAADVTMPDEDGRAGAMSDLPAKVTSGILTNAQAIQKKIKNLRNQIAQDKSRRDTSNDKEAVDRDIQDKQNQITTLQTTLNAKDCSGITGKLSDLDKNYHDFMSGGEKPKTAKPRD